VVNPEKTVRELSLLDEVPAILWRMIQRR